MTGRPVAGMLPLAALDGTQRPVAGVLPLAALDERLSLVGTSGSGKTYAAKGLVELLLDSGARVCVVDPLGVWWGLRTGADGMSPGYPVVVFGGRHADVDLHEGMGEALGRLVGTETLACVVDLSELGSGAARRRFMQAFSEAVYETCREPLHLVLDEADLWAPQRPLRDALVLLGRIEEIVRRGRVRGFIPWLITQRPAVLHKDVLSQADVLIAMRLTASQDRDAIGGWIEGQAERAEGKRILADLPKLSRGEGYVWAPGHEVLARFAFPSIFTYDSSRTPGRGERLVTPRMLAKVDLSAITKALATPGTAPAKIRVGKSEPQIAALQQQLAAAQARVAELDAEASSLRSRLAAIGAIAGGSAPAPDPALERPALPPVAVPRRPAPEAGPAPDPDDATLHPAARKLLGALVQHAPARFTWGQTGLLAGLRPSGGHFNAGRKQLRELHLVLEEADLVTATSAGLLATGDEVPPGPSSPEERLALWCSRLPSPAPEMLRGLAAYGETFVEIGRLAAELGKKPTGGHWNGGIAVLRNNGLIEIRGKELRIGELFRMAGPQVARQVLK